MKKTLTKCALSITTAALNLTFVLPSLAAVIPPTSPYAGKTLYQWSADWWTTFLEAPHLGNPLSSTDPNGTGLEAINDPSSPVFFLTGISDTTGGAQNRSVRIPENQAIFFPLVNFFNTDSTVTLQDLCAASNIDSSKDLFATLDGVSIGGDLSSQRQNCSTQPDSGSFNVKALPGNELQYLADSANVSLPEDNLFVSDGYWLMLTPLTAGQHTITFGGTLSGTPDTIQNNTYNITVTPVPEPSLILGLVSLGTLGAFSTLKRKR